MSLGKVYGAGDDDDDDWCWTSGLEEGLYTCWGSYHMNEVGIYTKRLDRWTNNVYDDDGCVFAEIDVVAKTTFTKMHKTYRIESMQQKFSLLSILNATTALLLLLLIFANPS
jgi:IS1 family transposase